MTLSLLIMVVYWKRDEDEHAAKSACRTHSPLNFCFHNDINGSFERQAVMRGIVRGRIVMPFTVCVDAAWG
ncbi:MAG TPA: hypothetical protein DEB39_01235 [Planctomycetaceae bacterium]|nr:hypothetical protein [Planctomycetaceae bacterium]